MAAGLLFAVLAAAAGGLLAAQAPINADLGRAIGSPVAATLVSFSVGALGAAAILLASGASVTWRAAPAWLYLAGGCLGVLIVLAGVILTPKLGAATYLACAVFGQMAAGLALDHVGAFGLEVHPVSLGRLAGVACVVAGAALLAIS